MLSPEMSLHAKVAVTAAGTNVSVSHSTMATMKVRSGSTRRDDVTVLFRRQALAKSTARSNRSDGELLRSYAIVKGW